LVRAAKLSDFTGLCNLLLKNETQNPTWSFKDRGSLTCAAMARYCHEDVTATISTGNMGNSMAAFGAKANLKTLIFVPDFTPKEKIMAMSIHGAHVFKVYAPDYSAMKQRVLELATELRLRIVSGNGPIRVEGYKLTSFEMYEQLDGAVPDYIAVPTSACGHVRGLFKGYRELQAAGLITKLPKMIIVQARNNSPIVSAIKQGRHHVIPFANVHTVAEAITTGNPMGGDELIDKAHKYRWLAEEVGEDEILEAQQEMARSGFFVEPATATSLIAVKKLREVNQIASDASVVLMLTGSGLKDLDVFRHYDFKVIDCDEQTLPATVKELLA
jgi:threonine synthase